MHGSCRLDTVRHPPRSPEHVQPAVIGAPKHVAQASHATQDPGLSAVTIARAGLQWQATLHQGETPCSTLVWFVPATVTRRNGACLASNSQQHAVVAQLA